MLYCSLLLCIPCCARRWEDRWREQGRQGIVGADLHQVPLGWYHCAQWPSQRWPLLRLHLATVGDILLHAVGFLFTFCQGYLQLLHLADPSSCLTSFQEAIACLSLASFENRSLRWYLCVWVPLTSSVWVNGRQLASCIRSSFEYQCVWCLFFYFFFLQLTLPVLDLLMASLIGGTSLMTTKSLSPRWMMKRRWRHSVSAANILLTSLIIWPNGMRLFYDSAP